MHSDDTSVNNVLLLNARERLRKRKRLLQAQFEAIDETTALSEEVREKIRKAAITVLLADYKAGKKLSSWERDLLVRHGKITPAEAATKSTSTADRVAAHMAQHSIVDWIDCADSSRRKRLEADPAAWLKWYCADTFTRPFEKPHHAIIEGAMKASRTGSRFAVVGERGIGKSVLLWGIVLMLSLSGDQPFPVCLPWDKGAVKRAFRFWRNALCSNDRILADYPEICAPFRHSKGVSQRLASTVWRGGPNDGKPTGAGTAISDGVIILPDCRGCFGGVSINSNPKGLNHSMPDGRTIRPTLALLDDVQDRETARSTVRVAYTIEIIDGDVAGMGEAGTNMPMLMSGNCIARDDVMEHYLASELWQSVRIPCVESWPDGWNDGKGPVFKRWQEWHRLYRIGRGSQTYYRQHKTEMTRGMVLSAPGTFRKSKGLPDSFCGVMLAYFKMGNEAFAAEKQQKPLAKTDSAELAITPAQIKARAVGPDRGKIPEGTIKIIAGADINPGITSRLGSRITWSVAAFGLHQSCCIIAYGIHRINMPKDPTISQQVSASYTALNELRLSLAVMNPSALIYDARGWFTKGVSRGQALHYSCLRLPGCDAPAMPAEGWSNESYRPTHKTAIRQFEGGHVGRDRIEQISVEWLAWNSDWVNLQVLRGWLAAPGAPGACILHGGRHDDEFCAQVSRRAYAGTVQKHSGIVYDWIRQPGEDDYSDSVAMCYVGAAWQGIGTGGAINARPTRKTYRQSDLRR